MFDKSLLKSDDGLLMLLLRETFQPLVFINVALVSLLQPENAQYPILVTLFGIVILFKPLQFSNAELPILVTLFGIVILVKLLQPEKA